MPSSFVPYEISPECIFYARGLHRDPEESQRPLEPEPGTWPLHRLGATVAEPEPGTSGTCWAGHRGTGTSEP